MKKILLVAFSFIIAQTQAIACPECQGYLTGQFKTIVKSTSASEQQQATSMVINKTLSELKQMRDSMQQEKQASGGGSYAFGYISASVDYMEKSASSHGSEYRLTASDCTSISSSFSSSNFADYYKEFVPDWVGNSYNLCVANCQGLKIMLPKEPVGRFSAMLTYKAPPNTDMQGLTVKQLNPSGGLKLANVWKPIKISEGSPVAVAFQRTNRNIPATITATLSNGGGAVLDIPPTPKKVLPSEITLSEQIKTSVDKAIALKTPEIIQQVTQALPKPLKVATEVPVLSVGQEPPRDIVGPGQDDGIGKETIWVMRSLPANIRIVAAFWEPVHPITNVKDFSLIEVIPDANNTVKVKVGGLVNNVTALRIKIIVLYQEL